MPIAWRIHSGVGNAWAVFFDGLLGDSFSDFVGFTFFHDFRHPKKKVWVVFSSQKGHSSIWTPLSSASGSSFRRLRRASMAAQVGGSAVGSGGLTILRSWLRSSPATSMNADGGRAQVTTLSIVQDASVLRAHRERFLGSLPMRRWRIWNLGARKALSPQGGIPHDKSGLPEALWLNILTLLCYYIYIYIYIYTLSYYIVLCYIIL